MTEHPEPGQQLSSMTARIIRDALATLRAEADESETAARLQALCDDAVTARALALYRRRLRWQEWRKQ